MNPISLLTKGRTIGGLKERPGRYKLLGNSVLPNFLGTKNPFPTTPHAEPEKTQTSPLEQAKPPAEPLKEEGRSAFVEGSPFARASAFGKHATNKTEDGTNAPKKDQPPRPGLWSYLAVIPASLADKWNP